MVDLVKRGKPLQLTAEDFSDLRYYVWLRKLDVERMIETFTGNGESREGVVYFTDEQTRLSNLLDKLSKIDPDVNFYPPPF